MFDLQPKYQFQLQVFVTESENNVKKTVGQVIEIEKFAVFGGLKRTIKKNGLDGIGDADIMAEFYQAKQFHNLIVTREKDNNSDLFRRIYDRKLPFRFKFTVKSLSPESRFRHLQLATKKAHLAQPPSPDPNGGGDTLNIKYFEPQVFYWYEKDLSTIGEKI